MKATPAGEIGMTPPLLRVALGDRRYRVERPWGDIRPPGKVTDVAALPDGRVAVLLRSDPFVDARSDAIALLDSEGRFLRSFGGELSDAHKIAADARGLLWVVDRDAHVVVAFDAEGREQARLGRTHEPLAPFNHPSDVAVSPDGRIVVADGYAGGHVHVFAPDLTPLASFGAVGEGPGEFLTVHGVWATGDGRILIADRENHRLQVFDHGGALLAVWRGFHRPSDIWGDAAGRLVVSDGVPTLSLLAPDGERLGRCRPVLNGAHGICGDAMGRFYLAEGSPSRITRLTPEAEHAPAA